MSEQKSNTNTFPKSILNQALLYYDKGYSVFPLKQGTKEPAVKVWEPYKTERATREQVAEWFKNNDKNIAVICGAVSGNLVVLDFDDSPEQPSFYSKFFKREEIEKNTPVVETSFGRYQVYLRSDKPLKSFNVPELRLEIRSEGRYVVAPPSIHPKTGQPYRFINTVESPLECKDLEESIWKKVEESGIRKRVFVDPAWRTGRAGHYKGKDPPCIMGLLKGVTKGMRHDVAIRLFAYFINFKGEGKNLKRVYEKMKKWNQGNAPPLEEDELTELYQDVAKGPYNYGCTDTVFRTYCIQENCEVGKNKISWEAIEKAQALTKDPEAFIQHLQQCLEYRLTGEWKNRLFLAVVGAGAQIQTSIIRICGPNAVGKNRLVGWMQEFFGADKVIVFSGATAAWLKRKVVAGLDTRGKIFIMHEERGEKSGSLKYTFEQIYSEDKILLGFNMRSEETGEWEPMEVTLQGPLCFITTSTELEFSLHAETREWQLYPDDSFEQTQRISAWYDWRHLLPNSELEREKKDIEVIRAYFGLIKPHKRYIVPYITKIDFRLKTHEDRRRKPDFTNLLIYATYMFQNVLPIDAEQDTVFALPFIFDFVMLFADTIVSTRKGALTKMEQRVFDFIKEHPEIYTLTVEGRKPRRIKVGDEITTEEKEGFSLNALSGNREFYDTHPNTIRNALTGLVKKRRLTLLRDSKAGSTPKIFGNTVGDSSDLEKGSLPILSPFSTDFLNLQIYKILYGKMPQKTETVAKTPIENCRFVDYKITPEKVLFQPNWAFSADLNLLQCFGEVKAELKTLSDYGLKSLKRLSSTVLGACVLCGKSDRMDFQADKFDGSHVLVCEECGLKLLKIQTWIWKCPLCKRNVNG